MWAYLIALGFPTNSLNSTGTSNPKETLIQHGTIVTSVMPEDDKLHQANLILSHMNL